MKEATTLGLASIFLSARGRISLTWVLVVGEIVLMALIPLWMGQAIDGLLAQDIAPLLWLGLVFAGLTLVAVFRRVYDTRVYGSLRVRLGDILNRRTKGLPISRATARQDMARELVDFLEEEVPGLISSVAQILIALIILFQFHAWLAGSALMIFVLMNIIYGLFHRRFYRLNAGLNEQAEQQVSILEMASPARFFAHLKALRKWEVKLSDSEAVVYGLIFLAQCAFLLFNLWLCARLPEMSVGRIFAILTYSWEFAEAAVALPMALQSWSRLSEITTRLNKAVSD